MTRKIVGISGSPSEHSKTRRLVRAVVRRISERTGFNSQLIDIIDLKPDLDHAHDRDGLPGHLDFALARVEQAELLIVGSPMDECGSSSLITSFFDLVDRSALARKPVVLTATGGGDRGTPFVEQQLRSLFASLGAATLPSALYVSDRDLADEPLNDPGLLQRLDALVEEAEHALERHPVPA